MKSMSSTPFRARWSGFVLSIMASAACAQMPAASPPPAVAPAPARTASAAAGAAPTAAARTTQQFGNWGVSCWNDQGQRFCDLDVELRRRQDNQRVVKLTVKPQGASRAVAGLVMPFGLDVRAGVTLQVDDGPVARNVPYQTCLPEGCVVDLSFDASALAALRSGKALKVSAPVASGGSFDVQLPLAGFEAGYAQMLSLAAQAPRPAQAAR